MISSHLNNRIKTFIESLSSEKGYSENTCRAYAHDLEEFLCFIAENQFAGKKKNVDKIMADEVDGMMIRGYLGFLHKRNRKVTIARKLSSLRSFSRSSLGDNLPCLNNVILSNV